MPKVGRPPLYTKEQMDSVLALRTQGYSVRRIAASIGDISKTTVHTIVQRSEGAADGARG